MAQLADATGDSFKSLLASLGIDAHRPTDVVHIRMNTDGSHLYEVSWHFCGRLLNHTDIDERGNKIIRVPIGPEFGAVLDQSFLLYENTGPPPDTFPPPTVQVWGHITVPHWVIAETEPFK